MPPASRPAGPRLMICALTRSQVRVIDLFREWDEDGDGTVSKKEFRKAMPLLGLEVPKKEIDALFPNPNPNPSPNPNPNPNLGAQEGDRRALRELVRVRVRVRVRTQPQP